MLKKQPKVRETLIYNSGSGDRKFIVTRIDGNILHYVNDKCEPDLIIWRFRDGLNACLSHVGA